MNMKNASEKTQKIAELNDLLRQTFWGGKVMLTEGVQQLAETVVSDIFSAVRDFDIFTEDNDPHGEHDFGKLSVHNHKIFWKIDYYDQWMEFASPDPSNPDVTERVLTIMLASEY